jgi:hypothetical protein
VFQAIHDGRPDQSLLAYQYLQMMPKIAEGNANKVWIVPSEIGKALEGLGSTMNSLSGIPDKVDGPRTRVDMGPSEPDVPEDRTLTSTHEEVAAAIAAAEASSNLGSGSRLSPASPTAETPPEPPPAGPTDPGEPTGR